MTPRSRDLPIERLRPGQRAPRAPRGFVSIRIRGVSHMARRAGPLTLWTLCHRPTDQADQVRPDAVCLTCAAAIAELYP